MIPYPDDAGFLKLDSNSTALSSQKNDHIYQIVLGVIAAIVVLICIIIFPIAYKMYKWKKKYAVLNFEYNKLKEDAQPNPEQNQPVRNPPVADENPPVPADGNPPVPADGNRPVQADGNQPVQADGIQPEQAGEEEADGLG